MFTNQSFKPFYYLIIGSLLFTYCKPKKQFSANKPAEFYNKAIFPKEISYINVPVTVPVAMISKQINQSVTGLLFEDNNLEKEHYHVKVWKNAPIILTPNGKNLSFSAPVKVWIKAGTDGGFLGNLVKETEFSMTLNYTSLLTVDPNWNVKSQTTSNGFTWQQKPQLDLGIIKLDLSSITENILNKQQAMICKALDDQIQKNIQLRKFVEDAWLNILKPIQLSDTYNTWLKLDPVSIIMAPLNGNADKIVAGLSIKTLTETFIGEKPDSEIKPLPLYQEGNLPGSDFDIKVLARISQANAAKMATKSLKGQNFEFQNGKYKVQIDSIDIWGKGQYLIIKSSLLGSLTGNVYLQGIPYYDSTNQSISLKEVTFDLDTKNKLLNKADWLAHDVFARKIEKALKIPISAYIKTAEKAAAEQLNNKKINQYITLNGKIGKIKPEKIIVIEDYLLVQIATNGMLDVLVSE